MRIVLTQLMVKKMNNLVLISHSYHSFLLNEIKYAQKCFDNVYVLTMYNEEIQNTFNGFANLHINFFTKKELHRFAFYNTYSLFSTEKINEQLSSIKNKIWGKDYIKKILFFTGLEYLCKKKLSKILDNPAEGDKWSVLACWYESDAYAVYKLKLKYPFLRTYSLCHSYEVDPKKSKFIYGLFRKQYHNSFEIISFISESVKNQFADDIAKKLQLSMRNVEVRYLGTQKKENGVAKFSNTSPFHIVTCSYVVPVKRVFDFFDILNNNVDVPIIWTHIGEGKDYLKFKEYVKKNLNNELLNVEIAGAKSNDYIHKMFSNERVDLFVNYSTSEGIPVSIMEAIAYGIPVVATNVGGNGEIVKFPFGTIIDELTEPHEVWNAIKRVLDYKYEIKKKNQEDEIEFFHNNFDSDKIRMDFYRMIAQ